MMMRVPELLEEDEYIRDKFGPYMSNAFNMKVSTVEDKGRTAKLIKFSDFKKIDQFPKYIALNNWYEISNYKLKTV